MKINRLFKVLEYNKYGDDDDDANPLEDKRFMDYLNREICRYLGIY